MSSMSGHRNELAAYRNSPAEIARTRDLLAIVPKNLSSVLDVGARDGHFSRLLTEHFESVTALDLTMPQFDFDRVRPVQGDLTKLPFPDDNFDVVFCAEVLEHVLALQKACSEIERVTRPGGRLVSLDFFLPRNPVLRKIYLGYLFMNGAFWGTLLHGRPRIYTYIPDSLRSFVSIDDFSSLLRRNGYGKVDVRGFLFGGIALHWAAKE